MNHPNVLLVSHDPSLIDAARQATSSTRGFELDVVADIEKACDGILGHDRVLVVLMHLDGRTSVACVTRILQAVAQARRPVAAIAICDVSNPEQVLALTRLGVAECLCRPMDLGRLAYLIDSLTIEARYALRHRPGPDPGPDASPDQVLSLGDDPPFLYVPAARMGRMVEQIRRIAPLDTSVMLGGETGTGKTHLAGIIHRLSPRRDQPFLTINCGALAANLVESEMFGHARGAFTGADAERMGKFAAVGRGTLFLDEIDSLPPGLQAKLLRVVEERAFEPVGSNRTQRLRARLIVASNRPLEQEVAAGRFRSDLYYRFNVVAFELPPLRDRLPLIPAPTRSLLAEYAARSGRRITGISPPAMRALVAHAWPGNIRELRNVIERAVALCPGEVVWLEDLPDHFQGTTPSMASAPPSPSAAAEILAAPGDGPGEPLVNVRASRGGLPRPPGRPTAPRRSRDYDPPTGRSPAAPSWASPRTMWSDRSSPGRWSATARTACGPPPSWASAA
jgi:DNA-binding NtrC family response regulator